jgi:chromosome partitioning protein
MKVVCVFNQKGGVGKTTTNINIASYVALKDNKVLVIDMDPQGNTTSGFGIDKEKLEYSTYDLLLSDASMDLVIQSVESTGNIEIIPSNIELAGADLELAMLPDREKILKSRLDGIVEKYDYVFIDCPPSLGLLTINALTAANSVIIPMQCEYYALEGISQLIKTINLVKKGLNKDLEIEGVVLTMFDSRRNLQLQVAEELKSYFGELVYENTIPRNVRLAEAPSFGLPIFAYDGKCKGAESYSDLADEFLRKQ